MKKYFNLILVFLFGSFILSSCGKFPVDENGLLISDRVLCKMTNFELHDEAHQSVKIGNVVFDTIDGKSDVKMTVAYGTNLKHVKPNASLETDCLLTPKMGVWTDFSDLANPRQYTVISGNRKVRRTYTIIITVEKPTN